MTPQAGRYRDLEVASASPAKLIAMVYIHVLSSLRLARQAMDANDAMARIHQLGRAHAGLDELLGALDFEQGGELALQLGALYQTFMDELLDQMRTPAPARLDRVYRCVSELHEAWVKASAQVQAPVAAAS